MRLYVYCLSDEPGAAPSEGLEGVGGARVRLFESGGLSVVVSDFEGERAPITREGLRAHNRVNAHVLARVTPLPFRFGTLADEGRLNSYVESNARALREALARVRGRVEMSVKVRLGPDAEVDARAEKETAAPEVRAGARGSGTAFLLAKRREMMGEESLKARAEEAAARLASTVGALARESDVRLTPEGPIVVRASHLVGRADVAEYRARLREAGARAGGMLLLLSGPWPPYSFGVTRV
jgi:hypothetical protein